jgi:DNA sulfur modification protein DndD
VRVASISIQNFKSYRDYQKITFGTDEKYITIIEGQMGHGKSNLLNAFYWCLFGQYWDSDKSVLIDDPNPNEVDLFNKGELLDNKSDGSIATLFVEIEFYDDDQSKYTLKRIQNGTYINRGWKFERTSKINLEKIDADTGEFIKFTPEESEGHVLRFFPRSLSNYFLFRGENRAQLVKLQGKKEFQLALQELSKIEVFTRAENHLSQVLDRLREQLASQASEAIKNEMEEILLKKKNAEKAKSEYEQTLTDLINIEQQLKGEYEYYATKIRENQKAFEFQIKKEQEERLVEEFQRQVQLINENKQKELTKRWAAMGVYSLFSEIRIKYSEAINSGHYPPDISQTLIDKILGELKCICGSNFKRGSTIYKKIEKLREIGRIDAKLLHEVEKLIHEVERGDQIVRTFPDKILEYDAAIRNILNEVKSKQTIINGYKTKIGKVDFTLEELQRKQDSANDEHIKTHDKIVEVRSLINEKIRDISTFETNFHKLEGKLDRSNLPAVKVALAEEALRATKELKKKFESSIYTDLEKYTQENWEILVYDKLYYDKVELDRSSMYFEVLDKDGQPSRAIMNTGHSILLVLSFISALIKIAKDVWEEDFPLIMDAPLSEIGESALPQSLLGFGKIFNQTILILKDGTVNKAIYNQIKDKVEKRYWIEFDRKKQHSKITAYNH